MAEKFNANAYVSPDSENGINKGNQFQPSDAMFADDVNIIINNQMYLQDKKADLESPVLTGTPKAPTAAAATENTQIASTAFVHNAIDADRPYATSLPTMANTAAIGKSDKVAREDHMHPTDMSREAAFNKNTAFNKNFGTSAGSVCEGNDARLSDARRASDVHAWAKEATKPSYSANEVGAAAASHSHTASEVGAAPASHSHSASEVGAALASHSHSASEVGAAPASHSHSVSEVGAAAATHTHSANEVSGITKVYTGSDTGTASSNTTAVATLRFAFSNGTLAIFTT